jgi:hypothetical protein
VGFTWSFYVAGLHACVSGAGVHLLHALRGGTCRLQDDDTDGWSARGVGTIEARRENDVAHAMVGFNDIYSTNAAMHAYRQRNAVIYVELTVPCDVSGIILEIPIERSGCPIGRWFFHEI